jgi:PncC family amidohydrolase
MKIVFALDEGALRVSGLADFINITARCLNRKGCEAQVAAAGDNAVCGTHAFVIAIGKAAGAAASVPASEDFHLLSKNIFDCLSGLFFEGGAAVTAMLFGGGDIGGQLDEIEIKYGGVKIFYYSRGHITTVKILCKDPFNEAVGEVFSRFKKNIYAEDDVSLSQRLFELLNVRGKTLSVAESLTGGQVCSLFIENPGASACFYEGVVCYSNESKIKRLGVGKDTIANYGAVSSETAYEMAAGLLAHGGCDVSIATTGIAGPTGATMTKPMGLTYIAIGTPEKVHVFKHIFAGGRTEVRNAASEAAMFYAIKVLKNSGLEYEEIIIK